ncbi:MAG TPA: M28 family peptidase [Thermoanaerobaculia bacterium]|nr:M28 family peptidase [Thermoanaerobaculia bacterium]
MRRTAAIVVPILLVLALAIWRGKGPPPKPAGAPANEFSSARAMAILRELLHEEVPHPAGTSANARVCDRIIARFRAHGYETTIQRRFACNALPACAEVENILARVPGTRGPAVLLVSHYDSVGAGPAASDDGIGTASLLEIARIVRNERTRNPIAFLITDAEEQGLLGAEAFVADETLLREAGVVVNVENRGPDGLANMFETSRGNRWLIRHFARRVARPQASSFFYTIYDLLPNDTDVSVFKRAGIAAMNFAAIGGVNRYHTPNDDLAHANPRTIQHYGDSLLATARALADADLDARTSDDATYFDILGFTLIRWPAKATIWIAAVSLVLLMFAARKNAPRAMTFGVVATFTAIVVAVLAGYGVSWLARLRSEGMNWVAHPQPTVAAMWLTGIAAALFAFARLRRWSDERAMLYGTAIVWHAVAIALALTLPGLSYLFLVPAAAVMICALARASEAATSAVAGTVAAILFFPLILTLYAALGGRQMIAITILIGMTATLVAPLFASARIALAAIALALVCAVLAIALPKYTSDWPRHLSLTYVDDPTAGPMWMTGTLTSELQRAARFAPANRALTPWVTSRQWSAPAPRMPLPRVEISATREGERVTIRVRSPRRANRLVLAVRGGTVVSVNGVPPAPRNARGRRGDGPWRFAIANAVEEMTVEIAARGALDAFASDVSYGLPDATLAKVRDASMTVPVHDGDLTITRARIRIPPTPRL